MSNEKETEVSEQQREALSNACDAINAGLRADGITAIVAVPVTTLIIAEQLLEQNKKLQAALSAGMGAHEESPSIIVGDGVAMGDKAQGPRPEHVHLCRDTAIDVANAQKALHRARGRR